MSVVWCVPPPMSFTVENGSGEKKPALQIKYDKDGDNMEEVELKQNEDWTRVLAACGRSRVTSLPRAPTASAGDREGHAQHLRRCRPCKPENHPVPPLPIDIARSYPIIIHAAWYYVLSKQSIIVDRGL